MIQVGDRVKFAKNDLGGAWDSLLGMTGTVIEVNDLEKRHAMFPVAVKFDADRGSFGFFETELERMNAVPREEE